MHEPRVKAALGLGYAVDPHGADHVANFHDTFYAQPGLQFDKIKPLGVLEPLPADELGAHKVATFRDVYLFRIALDHLVLCILLPYDAKRITDILAAVTISCPIVSSNRKGTESYPPNSMTGNNLRRLKVTTIL